MDRGSQLDEDDADDKEDEEDEEDEEEEDEAGGGRRRKEEEEEEDEEEEAEATNIKSNNPHLAGGEKCVSGFQIFMFPLYGSPSLSIKRAFLHGVALCGNEARRYPSVAKHGHSKMPLSMETIYGTIKIFILGDFPASHV